MRTGLWTAPGHSVSVGQRHGLRGCTHLGWGPLRAFPQDSLFALVLALRRLKSSELLGGGPDQLHFHAIFQASFCDRGVVADCSLAFVQELLVLWWD